MRMPSTRAQDNLDRLANWWAGAWRWALIAMGAVVAIIFLLTSGGKVNGVTMAIVLDRGLREGLEHGEHNPLGATALREVVVSDRDDWL